MSQQAPFGAIWARRSLRLATITAAPLLLLTGAFASLPIGVNQKETVARKPAGPGAVRQVRVSAATIRQLPAGRIYLIDLKQRNTVYEFDPTSGRIDYSRIVVRTKNGDVPLHSFLEKRFKGADLSGWELRKARLTVSAVGKASSAAGLGLKAPTKKLEFTCNAIWCECHGDDDCNDMFTTNVCGDIAFCTDTSCYCERP